jgi:hypothetical protein
MATGTVILPLLGAVFDPTNPPAVGFKNAGPHLDFDSATDELIYVTFRLPADYASAPVLKFQWGGVASVTTSHTVRWSCEVMALTADTDGDPDTDSYDTVNAVDDDILGTTAGRIQEASLSLTNFDSGAAGDWIKLKIYRDANHANDDLPEDARLWALSFEYTTS